MAKERGHKSGRADARRRDDEAESEPGAKRAATPARAACMLCLEIGRLLLYGLLELCLLGCCRSRFSASRFE